jgi:hypothetical protein
VCRVSATLLLFPIELLSGAAAAEDITREVHESRIDGLGDVLQGAFKLKSEDRRDAAIALRAYDAFGHISDRLFRNAAEVLADRQTSPRARRDAVGVLVKHFPDRTPRALVRWIDFYDPPKLWLSKVHPKDNVHFRYPCVYGLVRLGQAGKREIIEFVVGPRPPLNDEKLYLYAYALRSICGWETDGLKDLKSAIRASQDGREQNANAMQLLAAVVEVREGDLPPNRRKRPPSRELT